MKLRIQAVLLLLLAIVMASCAGSETSIQTQNQNIDPQPTTSTDALLKYQDAISVDYMRNHLTVFASDSLQGRETGTPGEEMAADFLAREYEKLGLKPVGDDGTYFQHFKLNATKTDSIVFGLYNTANEQKELVDRSTASKNSVGNFVRQFGGSDSLRGQIVFAGFGVNDPAHNVSNLNGADLKGKWVMVFQSIPHVANGDTLINPSIDARARFQSIMQQGAAGILLIPAENADSFETMAKKMQSEFGEIGSLGLAYRDDDSGSSGGFNRGYNVINPKLAAQMLDLNSVDKLQNHRQELINGITDLRAESLDYELSHIPYTSKETINSKNVLAFYEGADPKLKDEVVVMTSHYDHVGIGQPDSTGDRIYNGADDDGSGTIGLLNIAKAFAVAGENGVKPKRSILFLNVSAEEKGLLGSRYYSDHPVFPMEKTVANINTDMIGRIDAEHKKSGVEEYAYIIGSEIISSDLDSLVKAGNARSGQIDLNKRYNDLDDPNQFYRRSDHWHFGRKRVPFVFFFTGVHEDYHRPSDEVHKIRFDKMSTILRTMYASAVMVANADQPPTVDNEEFIEITASDN